MLLNVDFPGLESESRILTKRLSTISITDEGPPPDPQQNGRRTVSPLQNRADDASASTSTGSYPHRPSAIPRPSYSRGSERAAVPLSPPPAEQSRKSTSNRQRTQSTPFPFDPTPSTSTLPNGKLANGIPLPSVASGSTSPRVQSPSLGRTTPTPSRIPTVSSRMRSGSQSSQGLGSLNGGKASLLTSHKLSPSESTSMDSVTQYSSLRVKGSSSSLIRQRIVDERPPFANEAPAKVLESEPTSRPSSDEERPYQHWYRGDVSRNGGVGEYRVGKRMEMLDIANYGHALRTPASRARPYEEPIPRSENPSVVARKRAESVSSMERASIYIDPEDDTVTGRVLDEMPLTDIENEGTEYEQDHYLYNPRADFELHHDQSQISYHDTSPHVGSSSTLSSQIPSLKSQTRIPQPQPRSNTPKILNTVHPAVASEPSAPAKEDRTERGRAPASANSRTKPLSKGQKRSKSAADALRGRSDNESSEYAGLADAVPDTRSPLPRDGNWDEVCDLSMYRTFINTSLQVILPTVARRMGIEYEKEDQVVTTQKATRVSRVVPVRSCGTHRDAKKDEKIRHPVHLATTTQSTNLQCQPKKFLWEASDRARLNPNYSKIRMFLMQPLPLRKTQMSPSFRLCGLGEKPCHPPRPSRNMLRQTKCLYPMLEVQVVIKRERMCLISWSARPPWMVQTMICSTKRALDAASVLSCKLFFSYFSWSALFFFYLFLSRDSHALCPSYLSLSSFLFILRLVSLHAHICISSPFHIWIASFLILSILDFFRLCSPCILLKHPVL